MTTNVNIEMNSVCQTMEGIDLMDAPPLKCIILYSDRKSSYRILGTTYWVARLSKQSVGERNLFGGRELVREQPTQRSLSSGSGSRESKYLRKPII